MNYVNVDTKTYKLLQELKKGKPVSEAYARNKLGIQNLSAEVSRVRHSGFAVHRATRIAGNNVKVVEYKLGQPTREIVALGYKAKSLGITL